MENHMTVKKRVVSKATRAKISAAHAARRAARLAAPVSEPALRPGDSPATRPARTNFVHFDNSTLDNLYRIVNRAEAHLSDYQLKMDREGFRGIVQELDKTIVALSDLRDIISGR